MDNRDISKRVRRAVWYSIFMPFAAPRATPPIVAWNIEGNKLRVDDASIASDSTPLTEQQSDLPIKASPVVIPCTVLSTPAGSNWIDDNGGWVAGWEVVQSPEPQNVYGSTMRVGPIGQSLAYIGTTGLIPCVTIATNQRTLLRGPNMWEGALISLDVIYHPPVENVGIEVDEAAKGRNHPPILTSEGGLNSSSPFGNYLSIWFGNTDGNAKKGNKYCLMFKIPSWEPELFCHRGDEPPAAINGVSFHTTNTQLNGWEKLRRFGQVREHFDFETIRMREIHFELRYQSNQIHLVIQPWGNIEAARFIWNVDETQEQTEAIFRDGDFKGHSSEGEERPSGIALHEKIMPEGRLYIDCSGPEQLSFVMRSEISKSNEKQTKSVILNHTLPWNTVKTIASAGGGTLSDKDIKDALKRAYTCVRLYPDHAGNKNVTPPKIEDIAVNVIKPEVGDMCQISTKITIKAGTKKSPGGGPTVFWYPTIAGVRGVVDPLDKDSEGIADEELYGSFVYLSDGKGWEYNADALSREQNFIAAPAIDGLGTLSIITQDPSDVAWEGTKETRTAEQMRGMPIRMVAGYSFIAESSEEEETMARHYRWWPVCTVYNEKTTIAAQSGTQYGTPSYQVRLDNIGRVALLEKARAFDLPAADGYSHLWMMRLLSRYCGITDSEMAPWRVPLYGMRHHRPFTLSSWNNKVSMAMASNLFAPQEDEILKSWDHPCPGNYNNTGGKNAQWRFKIEPGGSVYEMMQKIAGTFNFLLFFDNLGHLHYEPDIFSLLCSGEFFNMNINTRTNIMTYLAKGEFCSFDHFSYDNSIINMESLRIMLGRHDGVLVVGETPYPTCVCGRTGCNQIGTIDQGGLYHYVRWGGSQPWNADNKIFAFRRVETSPISAPGDPSYNNMVNWNPMNRKNWLYVSSPHLTNMGLVNQQALYLQYYCRQWWIGDTYQIVLTGQPHIYPGDFLSIKLSEENHYFFYVKAVRSQIDGGKFVTSAVGILIPKGIGAPPKSADDLKWAGAKPVDTEVI